MWLWLTLFVIWWASGWLVGVRDRRNGLIWTGFQEIFIMIDGWYLLPFACNIRQGLQGNKFPFLTRLINLVIHPLVLKQSFADGRYLLSFARDQPATFCKKYHQNCHLLREFSKDTIHNTRRRWYHGFRSLDRRRSATFCVQNSAGICCVLRRIDWFRVKKGVRGKTLKGLIQTRQL